MPSSSTDDVRVALYRLGGVASRRQVLELTGRAQLERALRDGVVLRDARGRYAVPVADRAIRAAAALDGVVSHRSAALWWGWEQKHSDHAPEVTVPRKRNVSAGRRAGLTVHWSDLTDAEVDGHVTSPARTLVDCLRRLPFDEALAIADSSLRNRTFDPAGLVALAARVGGPGAAACRRVAAAADARAASVLESVLRAIALSVPGLRLVPQGPVVIAGLVRHPDLCDLHRRLAVEADSFTWHGSRGGLRRDCRRYNLFTLAGWTVLRFSWEDVMHDPAYVRSCLQLAEQRAQPARGRWLAA